MKWLDHLRPSSPDSSEYQSPEGIPTPEAPRELVLYTNSGCPFCRRVQKEVTRLSLDDQVTRADPWGDPAAKARLAEVTGRTTIPCLFIDGVPFFESRDINAWLQAYAHREEASDQH